MERFEARYNAKSLATVSTSIKVFFGVGGVLIAGFFLYYALALSEAYRIYLAAIFAVVLVGDIFIYRIAGAKIRRFLRHARSGLPAITFDRRGVWVHERTGDQPVPWELIEEIEEVGTEKNRAIHIRSRSEEQPLTIPAGFYDTDIAEIGAALKTLKERYG